VIVLADGCRRRAVCAVISIVSLAKEATRRKYRIGNVTIGRSYPRWTSRATPGEPASPSLAARAGAAIIAGVTSSMREPDIPVISRVPR
jgi:hypothetical protein